MSTLDDLVNDSLSQARSGATPAVTVKTASVAVTNPLREVSAALRAVSLPEITYDTFSEEPKLASVGLPQLTGGRGDELRKLAHELRLLERARQADLQKQASDILSAARGLSGKSLAHPPNAQTETSDREE